MKNNEASTQLDSVMPGKRVGRCKCIQSTTPLPRFGSWTTICTKSGTTTARARYPGQMRSPFPHHAWSRQSQLCGTTREHSSAASEKPRWREQRGLCTRRSTDPGQQQTSSFETRLLTSRPPMPAHGPTARTIVASSGFTTAGTTAKGAINDQQSRIRVKPPGKNGAKTPELRPNGKATEAMPQRSVSRGQVQRA